MKGYKESKKYKIYETNDFSIFHKLNGNRRINTAKVNNIKASMKEFGVLPTVVLVYKDRSGKFYIADGQHTVEAAKALNETVYFVIIDENVFIDKPEDEHKAALRLCQEYNNCSHNWSIDDYVDSYVDDGNPNYIQIKNWKDQYKFITYSMLQAMIGSKCNTAGAHGGGSYKTVNLRKGILDITEPLKALMDDSLQYLDQYQNYVRAVRGKGRKEDWYTFFLKLRTPLEGSPDWHRVNVIFEENRMTKNLGGIDAIYEAFSKIYNKALPKSSMHFFYDSANNIYFRQAK